MKKILIGLFCFFAIIAVLGKFGLFQDKPIDTQDAQLVEVTSAEIPVLSSTETNTTESTYEDNTTEPTLEYEDNTIEETYEDITTTPTYKDITIAPTNGLSELKVYFIDVGQSDATLITCGGESMLIDAGENDKGTAIQLFLNKNGVDNLKYLIGTHADSDHIGGMDVIITKFACETIMLPEVEKDTNTYRDVVDAMEYKRYKNTPPTVGTKYKLGDAEFTIIAPNGDYADNHNNWSIGLILEHGANKFLFTGDTETEGERDIVSNGIDVTCDVYKVGHHGSNTSSTKELLDATKPKYAVISCGKNNSYGHPSEETLNKLKENGISVFRTDEQGTIIAISDGKDITFDYPPSETWKAGSVIVAEATTVETSKVLESKPENATSENTTYILNTSSKKFHYSTCNGLPTKNRKDTQISRDEIIAKGYQPCKRCNP